MWQGPWVGRYWSFWRPLLLATGNLLLLLLLQYDFTKLLPLNKKTKITRISDNWQLLKPQCFHYVAKVIFKMSKYFKG
jgi:hypothetical protein